MTAMEKLDVGDTAVAAAERVCRYNHQGKSRCAQSTVDAVLNSLCCPLHGHAQIHEVSKYIRASDGEQAAVNTDNTVQ